MLAISLIAITLKLKKLQTPSMSWLIDYMGDKEGERRARFVLSHRPNALCMRFCSGLDREASVEFHAFVSALFIVSY